MTESAEFAAFVGLDWDDDKHAACVLPAAGEMPKHAEVQQTPEAIAGWVAELRERFGGRRVAICLEQSRGALVYALMQYDFLVLHPINPKQLSDYRDALYPSGAKSDPNDAELLARFLREHTDKVRAWHPDDEVTRGLRLLTEQRRQWVQQRVALTNQLQQRLKESYPLALQWGGDNLCSEAFLALLERFPSQRELQRASPKQLEKWLPKPRRAAVDDLPTEELLRNRIATIRKALPMTTDRPVLEHARLVLRHVVVMIRTINRAIAECDQKIAELFTKHPDSELFASFPGAGKALAPRLAAAYGSQRDKFQDAREMQHLSGIAPVPKPAARRRSCKCGGPARSSCGRRFTSSPVVRSSSPSGPVPTSSCGRPADIDIKRSSGVSRSNGNGSSSVVGKLARATTRAAISNAFGLGTLHSSPS